MTTPDLPRRFVVRHADDGTWGVWDTVINAARSPPARTGRGPSSTPPTSSSSSTPGDHDPHHQSGRSDPPSPSTAPTGSRPALLDHWIRVRADDSLVPRFAWYGRVRTDAGTFVWLPAEDLRKADPTS